MFKDHPLTGIGLGNFSEIRHNYYRSNLAKEQHVHAHNIYLQFLAETEIEGFISFSIPLLCVLLVIATVVHDEKYNKWMLAAYLVTLSIMVQGLTEYIRAYSSS